MVGRQVTNRTHMISKGEEEDVQSSGIDAPGYWEWSLLMENM